jgi:hypothetical protein
MAQKTLAAEQRELAQRKYEQRQTDQLRRAAEWVFRDNTNEDCPRRSKAAEQNRKANLKGALN